MSSMKKIICVLVLIFVTVPTGIFVGRWTVNSVGAEGAVYKELRIFTEALSIVRKHYVEDVNPKDLIYNALRGMLNSLDPHSGFMTPEAYKEMQAEKKGRFGGIGIQIGIRDGALTVIAPIEGTPAYRAGIKAGDKIMKINDEFTKDMGLHGAVRKMRGAPNTSVTITILREGWEETKDFTIVREMITIKSVRHRLIEDDIGYIKISQFHERTADDLSNAMEKLMEKKMNALILDLRNNPGGLLHTAVDVTSQFLPPGRLVVYTKGKGDKKIEYNTKGGKPNHTIPMVVLVNKGSASASEIVAGALKDWNRAVIVGTQTFGKGSVQSMIPLSDGSGLRLTTAKHYTPKGTSIEATGIMPDIIVKPEVKDRDERHPIEVEEKEDTQLQRAIDLLKSWRVYKEWQKAA